MSFKENGTKSTAAQTVTDRKATLNITDDKTEQRGEEGGREIFYSADVNANKTLI